MKKKLLQRKVGRDGKYTGLFSSEKRCWSSDEYGMEKALREYFSAPRPTIAETIDQREKLALAIIEGEGYEIQKPYRFHDAYPHDKGEAILTGLIDIQIGTDEGSLTPLGMAAQILTDCHILRQSIEAGNVEKTAHHAMLLQQSVDHLNFMQWEYPARVGEAQLVAKNVAYSADDRAAWAERFAELRAENPKISKRKAAKTIEGETGHKAEAIRKSL